MKPDMLDEFAASALSFPVIGMFAELYLYFKGYKVNHNSNTIEVRQ